ncbi:MAG: hypothetical protein R3F12_00270 [Lysobacteraceae bacterium]
MRHLTTILLLLLAGSLYCPDAHAIRGRLEERFGTGGMIVEPFDDEYAPGSEPSSTAIAVLRYPGSGQLLVVSQVYDITMNKPVKVGLARYFPDGELDTGFGDFNVPGLRLLDWNDPRQLHVSNALMQPDGRVLIVADVRHNNVWEDHAVCRITAAGTLDPSFGVGGCITLAGLLDPDWYYDDKLALDATGRIHVGAQYRMPDDSLSAAVVRLTADGQIDTSFGISGVSVVRPAGAESAVLADLGVRPDGRIVIFGGVSVGMDDYRFFVTQLLDDGNVDNAYGPNDGVHILDYAAGNAISSDNSMLLLADGRTALFGRGDFPGVIRTGALMLSADGKTLDPTWGTGLNDGYDLGDNFHPRRALQTPEAGFVLGGYTWIEDSQSHDPAMIALDDMGGLDLRFGEKGRLQVELDAVEGPVVGRDYALAMTWSNDRVMLAGSQQIDDNPNRNASLLIAVEMHDVLFRDGLED